MVSRGGGRWSGGRGSEGGGRAHGGRGGDGRGRGPGGGGYGHQPPYGRGEGGGRGGGHQMPGGYGVGGGGRGRGGGYGEVPAHPAAPPVAAPRPVAPVVQAASSSSARPSPPPATPSSSSSLVPPLAAAAAASALARDMGRLAVAGPAPPAPSAARPGAIAAPAAHRSLAQPAPAQQHQQPPPAPPVSSKGMAHPARPGYGTVGTKVMVRANHFFVEVEDKESICHYDVSHPSCHPHPPRAFAAPVFASSVHVDCYRFALSVYVDLGVFFFAEGFWSRSRGSFALAVSRNSLHPALI
jgi:eukaryotic translation initiation factor 2C